jgi:hypothetical protein
MNLRNFFALILVLLISTSCATMFTGTKSKVLFSSVPPGAQIFVNGVEKGVTPASVRLKRSLFETTTVTLKKEGYENVSVEPETTFQALTILNLANPVGWAIDVATGAIVKYSPNNYEMTLSPQKK